MKNIVTLLLCSLLQFATLAQAPDFTMTDINGTEYSLYEDFLDQGKTVFISVAATWNPWDEVWVESGVLDAFQAQYGNDGIILFIEGDPNTPEGDLYGTGNSTEYDFVTGHDYIIMDDGLGIMTETYGINFFPYVFIICPDGTAYTQSPGNPSIEMDDDVFYGNFQNAEDIADKMYELCGTDFDRSKLNGIVYIDSDSDCEEDGETGVPMMIANIDGPTGSFYRVTDENGTFRSLADEGEYTVEIESPNPYWDICDNPQSYTFGDTQDSVNLDFGLQATLACTEPTVDISAPFLVRCFETSIYVHYCNEGTIPGEDMVVTVTLDSFILVDAITPAPTSQDGLTYTFEIGTLGVFECGDIEFNVTIDCDAELGTEQCYSAEITPDSDCIQDLLSESAECQEIVGSFDPNDKRAYPFQEGDEYSVGPNETMKYQIRFQNTGTFTAFNVEVLDTIDERLNLSTLRMGSASHDFTVEIIEDRTLQVRFENINLPDSTSNEPESHGFFNYYIDQVADLQDGSTFENSAGIYFDFNEPVITNTTIHTVDYNITSVTDENQETIQFTIAPNPAMDEVRLTSTSSRLEQGQFYVYSLQGAKLLEGKFQASEFNISLESIPDGIYFIQLTSKDGASGVQKLVKL